MSRAGTGDMVNPMELYGSEGVVLCDLLPGSALQTHSKTGCPHALGKVGSTVGWTLAMHRHAWDYHFHHEPQHFVDCVPNGKEPLGTGQDSRAVLEIILAAYQSAGSGGRVEWPWEAPRDPAAAEMWARRWRPDAARGLLGGVTPALGTACARVAL